MEYKILLDANFVIDVVKNSIDLKEELQKIVMGGYKLVTISKVVEEVKSLESKGDRHAKTGLKLLESLKVPVIQSSEEHADNIILDMGRKDGSIIVATNDLILRKRLKEAGVKNIYIRSRKHLVVV